MVSNKLQKLTTNIVIFSKYFLLPIDLIQVPPKTIKYI